jgi:hypothetical protein
MAKVQGPLFSMGASGKVGDAMVFSNWKGINVVRQWVIPVNKMTTGQGDQRIMLGGTGRACGEVIAESAFADQLITLGLIPSGQSKQSYLVKYILDHYIYDGTSYATQLAALTGHSAYASWGTGADTLGLVEFDLDYASVAPYNKALGLYLLAKTAIALGFTGTPYTVALASWTGTQINAMISHFTA